MPSQELHGKAFVKQSHGFFMYECEQMWKDLLNDQLLPGEECYTTQLQISRELFERIQRENRNGSVRSH
jgi:hypothetical protein